MLFADVPKVGGGERVLGHMRVLHADRMGFLARLTREVDRVSRLEIRGRRTFVVNHPDVLHELLVEGARTFEKSDVTRFALYPLAGEGLFTSNGDLWRRQRKLMAPLFHAGQLESYAADMVAASARGRATWKDGQTLSLAKETTHITMSIAGKTLFDADTFSEADAIGDAITVALDWAAANAPSFLLLGHLLARRSLQGIARRGPLRTAAPLGKLADRLRAPLVLPGERGKRLRAAIALLDTRVQAMIDARRGGAQKNDLLARLLRAQGDDGAKMSDRQVRDEVLTLFLAGHETTATALAWAVHCLCKNPAVYERVQAEVDALAGEPTFADLSRLPLTLRVFKEALRLYPPVPLFTRQAREEATLDGVTIRRNDAVLVSPWALHRRADLWPDPERFDPDRFLPERESGRSRYAWLPFGAGARVCIGAAFAMIEGQLVLASLLRHVRFESLNDEVPEVSATLRPRSGMPMRVHVRRSAPVA
jgi:cytochrome P450